VNGSWQWNFGWDDVGRNLRIEWEMGMLVWEWEGMGI